MNIREINRPVTAKSLNESLAKRFGQKIALDKFTTEQLQDVRNKIRTTMSQVETNESFDTVQSESYQKNKLFLDVLNAEIVERADVVGGKESKVDKNNNGIPDYAEDGKVKDGKVKKPAGEKAGKGSKPDFLDMDKDGDKKEPMKKATKDAKKESVVREGAEDQAELVMAAKNMVDRVTSWMEDTAEMQTESMLELADAIRDEKGQEASDAYVNTVKPALESLYGAMEVTRQALTSGVGQMTGEQPAETDMGTDMDAGMDADMDMEPTVDGEEDFAAADAAAGGDAEAGRERRESIARKKSVLETSRRLGTILSKKK
jgi:hypothetical protein